MEKNITNIQGKNILFIAPKFYNYHTDIINFLEKSQARVTFFPEDVYTPVYRFFNRVFPIIATYIKNKYLNLLLKNIKINRYDIVFVIRGGILMPLSLEQIKTDLPNAKFIMYQWDSDKQSNYKDKIKYFDIVMTFDKEDAINYNIEYLPLFYTQQYQDVLIDKKKKKFDLVFYGAYHSNRLEIIKYLDKFFIDNDLVFKHHLYITKLGLIRMLAIGKVKLKDLKFLKIHSVDSNEILNSYKRTVSVLDIELNIQSGLTMRTFEALGAGVKLITTNTKIIDEPFYDKNVAMVIDRINPDIDINFFNNNLTVDKNFRKYSFDNWLNNIFTKIN
jgi:hypothetical protein